MITSYPDGTSETSARETVCEDGVITLIEPGLTTIVETNGAILRYFHNSKIYVFTNTNGESVIVGPTIVPVHTADTTLYLPGTATVILYADGRLISTGPDFTRNLGEQENDQSTDL